MARSPRDTEGLRVRDVIAQLEDLDAPDLRVLVCGYEGDYENANDLWIVKVKHNPVAPWYNGDWKDNLEGEPALLIRRR